MKLIVGLGNPGKKYAKNRHNLGFLVVDNFAKSQGVFWQINKNLLSFFVKRPDYVLAKPTTFVNQSGSAVKTVADFYKIAPRDILVIHDDLDLPFGKIRLTFGGASAGHKGVESVMAGLGTADFGRLRIGIGRPALRAPADVEKYVLSDFLPSEKPKLTSLIKKCQEAITSYLKEGLEATSNLFN